MGRVANQKRKKFFDELMRKDVERQAVIDKPRKEVNCCLHKYESKLPKHFVKCYNCPLDTT
jgi:hypothetical protein